MARGYAWDVVNEIDLEGAESGEAAHLTCQGFLLSVGVIRC